MTGVKYSAHELNLIATHYPDIDFLQAHLPHRTTLGIRAKVIEMGLARRRDWWAMAEDRVLREFYPDRSKTQQALPLRTWSAITGRAKVLGITRPRRTWSSERKEVLAKLAGKISDREIAEIMGGSKNAIATKRRRIKMRGLSSDVPKPIILPIINDIRMAARAKNIVLTKITNALGCQKLKPCLTEQTVSVRSVVNVVKALGGELYVEWKD